MNRCFKCNKVLADSLAEDWHDSHGEVVSIGKSDEPYALIYISGREACICEKCYIEGNYGSASLNDVWEIHYQFALEYRDLGRYLDSLKSLRQVPDHSRTADMWAAIGYVYGELGNSIEERKAYFEALKVDPGHADALENLKKEG